MTENSIWKRSRRYAGHNKVHLTPNSGSECPSPENGMLKPPSVHPSHPCLSPWLYLLLQDTARPLPVIRYVVHIHMKNSSFDLQKSFTALIMSLSVAHDQAADTHSLVFAYFDCRYTVSKCPLCCTQAFSDMSLPPVFGEVCTHKFSFCY